MYPIPEEFNDDFIKNLEINPIYIVKKISEELEIPINQVNATINLIKEGNTIPFISRYRKEVTGSLNEVQVRDIFHKLTFHENLEERRIEIIKNIYSQGKLNKDLYINILKCQSISELEDIYAPYKKKKKTRAMIAIEKGLQELAELMEKIEKIEKEAERFVDPEKGVNNIEEALQGAMDIIAEKIAQDMDNRKLIRDFIINSGEIITKGLKDENTSVYKMYYNYKEPLKQIKPHRILAINRGEREEELEVKIEFNDEKAIELLVSKYKIANNYHKEAITDGYKRLLLPSVIREIRNNYSEEANKHGINVFAENLRSLLMQPPIKKTRVLGIDPGIRTGTKAAALDETGKYLGSFVFYQEREDEAKKILAANIMKYKIELIAIGNGTGSIEVQQVVADTIREFNIPIYYTVVSEDGASVYSASEIGTEEFPDLDVTIRGAISIGRRIQDPLAELVKIDPKSIGVGLYQHDVNQKALSETLDEVVESVVNNVGVDINTASYALLKYVSGINLTLAKNIVNYREDQGLIKSRNELLKIPGFGEKTFQQAAGFLKVPESDDILDNTWVHPENYKVAREILELMKNKNDLTNEEKKLLMEKYNVGLTTINDIIQELKKPNRDPREDYPAPIIQKGVLRFEDLKEGMKVKGKIKNVVDFGAFVDIGIKEVALVHVSHLSDNYIKNPLEAIKVGDVKEFTIIEIDQIRKRISLSLKSNPFAVNTNKDKNKTKQSKNYAPGTLGSYLKNIDLNKL